MIFWWNKTLLSGDICQTFLHYLVCLNLTIGSDLADLSPFNQMDWTKPAFYMFSFLLNLFTQMSGRKDLPLLRFIAFHSVASEISVMYLIWSGESSRSFLRNLLMVSSMVLPILSLISPSFSLNGKLFLFFSQSSSHLPLDSGSNPSPAENVDTELVRCWICFRYLKQILHRMKITIKLY